MMLRTTDEEMWAAAKFHCYKGWVTPGDEWPHIVVGKYGSYTALCGANVRSITGEPGWSTSLRDMAYGSIPDETCPECARRLRAWAKAVSDVMLAIPEEAAPDANKA